jgi:predicted dehydrogenase
MTYKAGIVGTGGVAGMGLLGMHDTEDIGKKRVEASHAGGYDASDRIDLVAVADVDEEKLATFGDVWGIPDESRYVGHEAMLAGEDLDVVSVCTPTFLHHDHVVDAARSAADPDVVWCEKPIASSVTDGEEMLAACEETGTELVVNHTNRFTDNTQQLHHLIQEEDILGSVRSVNAQFRMELMRNSTHLLDTLVYLLDARARRVSGYITGENEAVDALEASRRVDDAGGGGIVVTEDDTFVTVDCTVPRDISTMTYQFVGTGGRLYLDIPNQEWRYWRLTDDGHVEEELPGVSFDGPGYAGGFANAVDHLADLVEGRAENHSPGDEALRSLEIILGFYLSEYTGSQVSVPLEPPLRDVTITSW